MRSKSFEEPTAIGQQVSVGDGRAGTRLSALGRTRGWGIHPMLHRVAARVGGRGALLRRAEPHRMCRTNEDRAAETATRSCVWCLGSSAAANRAEAVRAIDRLAIGRAEGDLGLLAARRAGRGEHLARARRAGAVAAP